MLTLLDAWQTQGMLRYIDVALARFLAQEVLPGGEPDPEAAGALALVLLGAALCSAQLGQGHACLDLQAVTADPAGIPGLSVADALHGLDALRWQAALRAWPQLVSCPAQAEDACAGRFTPLVLAHGRLYLHRLWRCEQDVQQGILQRLGREDVAVAGALDAQQAAAATNVADAIDDAQTARLQQALDVLFPSALTAGAQADTRAPADAADNGGRDTAADQPADWQKIACVLASRQRFGLITGGPGTGKTTTVLRLLALLQWQALATHGKPLRIGLAAPTGKAAARLSGSIAGAIGRLPLDDAPQGEVIRAAIPHAVSTLHRLLGSRPDSRHFRHDARNPLRLDVLVIDEASMIDLEMMAAVMHALPASARLILLGDKDQLASVEAGAILGELCARAQQGHYWPETAIWVSEVTREVVPPALQDVAGTPLDQSICMLRHSHRFGADSGIGRLAAFVNAGDVQGVARLWREAGQGAGQFPDIARYEVDASRRGLRELVIHGRGEQPVGYAHYLQVMHQHQPASDADPATFDAWAQQVLQAHGRFQLLCALRQGHWGVDHLNRQIAVWLQGAGLLAASEGWYAGRPVMITHNDYELGLMNGDVGITLAGP
ncbi:MAG: exodeoxyribonuclease V subunit alpha, partial [Lautropia sp.]